MDPLDSRNHVGIGIGIALGIGFEVVLNIRQNQDETEPHFLNHRERREASPFVPERRSRQTGDSSAFSVVLLASGFLL